MVAAQLRRHGVDVRVEDELARVETDAAGRVCAIETTRGEKLGCQLLGVCVGVEPQVDWLRAVHTPPAIGSGIGVDEQLQTSLANVWAAGDCAELRLRRSGTARRAALVRGEAAGRGRRGEPLRRSASRIARPPSSTAPSFFDIEYTTVGELSRPGAEVKSLYRRSESGEVSQRIVHLEGQVIGFNMLGSRWDHELLTRWIEEQRELSWVRAHLSDAQLDVELGRVDSGAHAGARAMKRARPARRPAARPPASGAQRLGAGARAQRLLLVLYFTEWLTPVAAGCISARSGRCTGRSTPSRS